MGRPQGSACDIGAVEASLVNGTGPTDLAVSFDNPPSAVVAGDVGIWDIRFTNRGNAHAIPSLSIDVPDSVTVTATQHSIGGACTGGDPMLCVWSSGIAPGDSMGVTITARVDSNVTAPLLWQAQVFAPNLTAPLGDDTASVSTPVNVP